MNQIGQPNNNNVIKYMQDIIGANMGFIFTQAGKDHPDGQMVIAMIRDRIRGLTHIQGSSRINMEGVGDAGARGVLCSGAGNCEIVSGEGAVATPSITGTPAISATVTKP